MDQNFPSTGFPPLTSTPTPVPSPEPESVFKNPIVIISLITFILLLIFAGVGWYLQQNSVGTTSAVKAPLSHEDQIQILHDLGQSRSTTSAVSARASIKILQSLQKSTSTTPTSSHDSQLKLLQSLK